MYPKGLHKFATKKNVTFHSISILKDLLFPDPKTNNTYAP